eukprot:TRINITY_DN12922_c0_g1_i1.p1 TRINITY_DN12922_c0_g1~~TRINITY_DN12922_c0_g1_i1.p1  ORF type:complete len:558 (-),score=129.13 TRINITY_DN12922_c0_g1_i1:80-1753(-)
MATWSGLLQDLRRERSSTFNPQTFCLAVLILNSVILFFCASYYYHLTVSYGSGDHKFRPDLDKTLLQDQMASITLKLAAEKEQKASQTMEQVNKFEKQAIEKRDRANRMMQEAEQKIQEAEVKTTDAEKKFELALTYKQNVKKSEEEAKNHEATAKIHKEVATKLNAIAEGLLKRAKDEWKVSRDTRVQRVAKRLGHIGLGLACEPKWNSLEEISSSKCFCKTTSDDMAEVSLHSRLHLLQHPKNCKESRILIIPYQKHWGIADQFHYIVHMLNAALLSDRALVLDGDWSFARQETTGNKKCTKPSIDCFFEKFTSCSEPDYDGEDIAEFDPEKLMLQKDRLTIWSAPTVSAGYMIPHEYNHLPSLWYWGQLLRYLIQPNGVLSALIQKEKESLGLTKTTRFLTVHLRKKFFSSKGLSVVQPHIKAMTKRFNLTHIFLSTDDEELVKLVSNDVELNWVWSNIDRKVDRQQDIDKGFSKKGIIPQDLVDLFIAIQGEALIGYFSSNWSRLIAEMMMGKKGYSIPVLSLDLPYSVPRTINLPKQVAPNKCCREEIVCFS